MKINVNALFLCLFAGSIVYAQSGNEYVKDANPKVGFWRTYTDPALRNTTVRFFNKDRQLLYEETLNGRYIDLNRKNVSVLNNLLAKLTTNQLVSENVHASDLSPESTYYKAKPLKLSQSVNINRPEGFDVQSVVLPDMARVLVQVVNPDGYRVHVYLDNEHDETINYNSVVKPVFGQSFKLNELPAGNYTIRVVTYNRKFQHAQRFNYHGGVVTLLD
jgi:hypothetical protein